MEQSSTLGQAKNQKTMRNTIDTAGRSILKQGQRKQQSLTTGRSIPVAGSAQIQHSTLKQAKTQKTMKTTIETAGRSIPNHGQRKQQSFTAGSSSQVAGSAQIQHNKHGRRPGFQTCFANLYLSIIIAPFINAIFICEAIVIFLVATFWLLTTITIPRGPLYVWWKYQLFCSTPKGLC
ncbi:hypothetical protein KIW84_076419 [Lathyrus oleraceus]|nr:hypothetical protein KIW84_076419 [Pisum sativum]